MLSSGLEPARPEIEQPQTYILYCMVKEIDSRRTQKCRIFDLNGVLRRRKTPYQMSVVFNHIHITKKYQSFFLNTYRHSKVTTAQAM